MPIAAFAAAGDIAKLGAALNQGLDAGRTVSESKEVLVRLYAYAGFPRSLNALGELMKVLGARKQCGIEDAPGRVPSRPIPTGEVLLTATRDGSQLLRCKSLHSNGARLARMDRRLARAAFPGHSGVIRIEASQRYRRSRWDSRRNSCDRKSQSRRALR